MTGSGVLDTTITKLNVSRSATVATRQQAGQIGVAPHQWPTPDGPPLRENSWTTPGRALASFQVHWAATKQYAPSEDITYRAVEDWLPGLPTSVTAAVQHLSRELLVADNPAGPARDDLLVGQNRVHRDGDCQSSTGHAPRRSGPRDDSGPPHQLPAMIGGRPVVSRWASEPSACGWLVSGSQAASVRWSWRRGRRRGVRAAVADTDDGQGVRG